MSCHVEVLCDEDKPLWEAYAERNGRNYHRLAWQQVVQKSFGHPTYYLIAKTGASICGILPLVFVRSWLFGQSLVSMPFFNDGGIVADTLDAQTALLNEASRLAKQVGAAHIELRQSQPQTWNLPVKSHKVAMRLDLPSSCDTLWESFSSKLKSQVRRPIKEKMEVRWGGVDQLDAFYRVFSINMRDLGTPVYSKRFFENILKAFPDPRTICVVYHAGLPVASAFLSKFGETMEIPWASSLRQYGVLSPNMLLYWSVLREACERGCERFDFGRCTPEEGTYKFKQQWGAKPEPLYWYYILNQGRRLPEVNVKNPKYHLAIALWQKLPVWMTLRIGPHMVKGIG
jgi:FemAB-related protein (PEP-CTERM system-associated)